MKILLIEDDARTAAFILKGLKQAGFTTVHAEDGKTGLFKAKTEKFDLAVIDIMLPVMDGFSVIEKIRAAKITTPIIILSAKNAVEDKIRGLQLGSDDYLAKPFHSKELLARIRAITRAQTAQANSTLKMGNVTLDRAAFELSTSKGSFRLANKEFQMLELLMCNPHQLISSERFLEKIWGYDSEAEINVVWVYISYLRKKLSALHADIQIKATRNAGYSLEERS